MDYKSLEINIIISEVNDCVEKYNFGKFSIIGGPNIHFNDPDLGNFNTLNIRGDDTEKPKKLYHLII